MLRSLRTINLFALSLIISSFNGGIFISASTASGTFIVVDDVTACNLAVAVAVAVAVTSGATSGDARVRKELDKRSTDGFGWIRTYNDDL